MGTESKQLLYQSAKVGLITAIIEQGKRLTEIAYSQPSLYDLTSEKV